MTIQLTNDGGGDVEVILERAADPAGALTKGKVYTKAVAGVTQLWYVDSAGIAYKLTPTTTPGDTPWLRTVMDVRLDQGGDTEVTPFDDNSTTFGLQSTGALTRRWLTVITGSNGLWTYNAAGDAQRSSFFGSAGLAWGPGGATATDAGMRRTNPARLTLSNADTGGPDSSAGLFPETDGSGAALLGDTAQRWRAVTVSKNYFVYGSGIANPTVKIGGPGSKIEFGDGATALSAGLQWSASKVIAVTAADGINSGSLIPFLDNDGTLGTSANRWASIVAAGAATPTSGVQTWDTGPSPTTHLSGSNAGGGFLTLGNGAAADVRLQRTTATTLTLDDGANGSIEVLPFAGSIQTNFGSSASIFSSFTGNLFNVWDVSGHMFPSVRLNVGGQINLGPGGATAPDVYLQRTGPTELRISDAAGTGGVDVIPPATVGMPPPGTGRLGTATNKWAELHAFAVTTGDVIFTDPGCPVCGQEFAEGDDLVMRVIKTSRAPDGSPLTRTVPCHHGCK